MYQHPTRCLLGGCLLLVCALGLDVEAQEIDKDISPPNTAPMLWMDPEEQGEETTAEALTPSDQKEQEVTPPVPVKLRRVSRRGYVGSHVRIGDAQFMVWGGLPSAVMPKGLSMSRDGTRLYASHIGHLHKKNIGIYHADPFRFDRYLHYKGSAIETFESYDGEWLFSTNMHTAGFFDIFDTATFEHKHQIRIPGMPKMILTNRAGTLIYLSLWARDGIERITWPELERTRLDLEGDSRFAKKHRSKTPRGMVLSADEKTLYVVNNSDKSMSIIDTETFKERKRIDVGSTPRHIIASPDNKTLYFTNTGLNSVAVFDPEREKIVKRIWVGHRPKGLDISKDGRYLYVANYGGSSLHIVDLTTYKSVELPLNTLKVSGLTVHPNDDFIYVSGWCTKDIWAIQRIDDGEKPHLPLGKNRYNEPCYTCPSAFTGCPKKKDIEAAKQAREAAAKGQ